MTNILGKEGKKENHLLKVGIITFLLFNIIAITLGYLEIGGESTRSTKFNGATIFDLLLMGALIAPLLEELACRGSFTKSKYLKYISYLLLMGFVFMMKSYFLIPFVLLFIFLREFKQNPKFIQYSYYVNALLFGLIHYQFSDLALLSTYPGILGTAGFALILIWLVLNFGLWASMLAHFVLNFSAILIMIISYENSDFSLKKIETQDFTMTYQKVSLFEANSSEKFTPGKEFQTKATSVFSINESLCAEKKLDKFYDGQYNITIKRKPNSKKVLDCTTFRELLDKSKIGED